MNSGREDRSGTTAWASFAAALAEGGWLAAVILVAIYFNTDAIRIFEEEKVFLFRSISLVVAFALAVWAIEGALRSESPRPLVKPVVALGCVYLLSVPFSIAPRVSFWGAYDRAQGAYTWLCYVVIFVAIVWTVRRRTQIERLVMTILIASMPLALYGVIQRLGTDPVAWISESFPRVHSMAGNSIFLGAVMIMVIPLTLACILERCRHLRRGRKARQLPLLLAYVLLLSLQILAVVYSQSRGPFLGLFAGMAVFLLAFAACTRRRWIAFIAAGGALGGVAFLIVFNLPRSPLAPLRSVPYVGRLGMVGSDTWSSSRLRVLVWESAIELMGLHPDRLFLGYGPDMLRFAFVRVRPEELSYHDRRNLVADRAHNETFDALVMTGVVGLVIELVVFVSVLFWMTRWLGLLRSPPQRKVFLGLVLGGAAIGLGGVLVIDRSFRFAGVAVPLGIVAGLFTWLLLASIGRLAARQRFDSDRLLLVGLLAAVVAHFVEIQFGIAVVATRLYFFVFVALAVALARLQLGDEAEEGRSSAVDAFAPLSPLLGLVLALLSFDFYRSDLDLQRYGATLAMLFAAPWLLSVIAVASDPRESGSAIGRVGSFVATSLGVWVLFLAVYLPARSMPAVSTSARVAVAGPMQAVTALYAFVLVVLLFYAGLVFLREGPTSSPRTGWRVVRVFAYGAAFVAAVVLAVNTNLERSWADILARKGADYEAAGNWRAAEEAYADAARTMPSEAIYTSRQGFAFMEGAKRTSPADWDRRHELLQQSLAALLHARRLNPANLDHTRNLAKLHHAWSTIDPDPERARRHLEKSESMYRYLAAAMPRNAGLMNEWATLYFDQGDMQTTLARLDDSLRIDGSYFTTYWMRGNALMKLGAFEEALAAYDRTLQLAPNLPAATSAKAMALASLGRLDEAIEVSQHAVDRNGSDLISRRNLIALLQRKGERERALEQARAALSHASGGDAVQFRELIAQLEMEVGGQGSAIGSPDSPSTPDP